MRRFALSSCTSASEVPYQDDDGGADDSAEAGGGGCEGITVGVPPPKRHMMI
jgi:hypothetical protein